MALFTKNPPVSPWWRIAHAASDKSALSIRQGFSRAANAIEAGLFCLPRPVCAECVGDMLLIDLFGEKRGSW